MQNSWGAEFHDLDDDGDLDLFMVGADGEPSKIFRNDGGNQFTDIDTVTGHPLLTDVGGSLHGGKPIDYDNDGDLDLIATTDSNHVERMFISDANTNGNHWLYIELAGPTDNTTGIGAALYATIHEGTPEERTLRRDANTNAGTYNQSDLPVHFGLGGATEIDQLRIVWPDGTVQFLQDVGVDQYLNVQIYEGFTGDLNGDGFVGIADLNIVLGNWNQNVTPGDPLFGDPSGDGFVGIEDLNAVLGNWNAGTPPPPPAAVPEPAAVSILCFATCALLKRTNG